MLTSYDKALAALVVPILSLLVLAGLLPEGWAGPEAVAGITSVLTAAATWLVPNK